MRAIELTTFIVQSCSRGQKSYEMDPKLWKLINILFLILTFITYVNSELFYQPTSSPTNFGDELAVCHPLGSRRFNNKTHFHLRGLLPYRSKTSSSKIRNFPFVKERISPGIDLALESIRREQILAPEYNLIITYANSACDAATAMNEAVKTYQYSQVDAFIGPFCDYAVSRIAGQLLYWDIPMLTGGAIARDFAIASDHEELHSRLTRTGPTFNSALRVVLDILEQFNWTRIYIMYEPGAYAEHIDRYGHLFAAALHEEITDFRKQGLLNITEDRLKMDFTAGFNITDKLKENTFVNDFSIFVVCASTKAVRKIMLAAQKLGYNNGEYVFLNVDLFSSKEILMQPWYDASENETMNEAARKAFEPVLTLTLRKPYSAEWSNFSNEVKRRAKAEYGEELFGEEEVNEFVGAFHDAVILYALALSEALKEGVNVTDGRALTRRMWNRTFMGISGPVSIDDKGDRDTDYTLLFMNKSGHMQTAANYYGNRHVLSMVVNNEILWRNGAPPPDRPTCGYDRSKCPQPEPFPKYGIVIIALGVSLILVVLVAVYATLIASKEIPDEKWRILLKDIDFISESPTVPTVEEEPAHSVLDPLIKSKSSSSESIHTIAAHATQVFTKICYVREDKNSTDSKGTRAAYKEVPAIDVDTKLKQEFIKLKELHNDNITRFFGVCIDAKCYFITEYCMKGSLQDVLEFDGIPLDHTFKLNIIQDIIKGMAYIHSNIGAHGRLKSSNCVVDNRYAVKVTDFGLHKQRRKPTLCAEEQFAYYQGKLWTAPELLISEKDGGTKEGDVYSFAIICQEIIYRNGVFWRIDEDENDMTPMEKYQLIMHPKEKMKPFRPYLEDHGKEEELSKEFHVTVRRCWSERPEERPTFQKLRREVMSMLLQKGYRANDRGNLVDTLLFRLEHYSKHLEDLVEDRTKELNYEKKMATNLLHRLFPPSVAGRLINKIDVPTEKFDCVTIYFSDICGFTDICFKSEDPIQVVELLNKLYRMFDKILKNYDVYKVETIGDAYMIVSGLPERNDDRHSREICRTALHLLRAVKTFKIPHMPDRPLLLRIGIHSGTVCAGVVGKTMPRYCLFGDTVNTASRMESNGMPLRIQISPETKVLLDKFQTFQVEFRGPVDIKGKGTIETWWLIGEDTPPRCEQLEVQAPKRSINAVDDEDSDISLSSIVFVEERQHHGRNGPPHKGRNDPVQQGRSSPAQARTHNECNGGRRVRTLDCE